MNPTIQIIIHEFERKGCTITSEIVNKTVPIEYICICGETKRKSYKDFIRRGCRTCNDKKLEEKIGEEYTDENGEVWKPIVGGMISSFGNAKNNLEKVLTLCPTKYRYRINGKHQYASRLVAKAFQIEGYENLDGNQHYIVSHRDSDLANNRVENLYIRTKVESGQENGTKARKSASFQEKMTWTQDQFRDVETNVVTETPSHIVYKNGEVWNGARFLNFSKSEGYHTLILPGRSYKVHRLICYAFHPLPDKTCLEDYSDLQVNHIDGNTLNNHADNLEWVTQSVNLQHAYDTNLNRKTRKVIQLSKETKEILGEYPSIAEASRQTREPEHRIRYGAQGNPNSKAEFDWKFENESETKEYSRKYSVQ